MFYALDHFGCRIPPSYTGQRASCPHCGNEVMAKCGEIYVWHWQHVSDQFCDSWKEQETAWHRDWKAKFPVECQEVSIVSGFEKHIADVRTHAGLVIEFQNSSISPQTIRIREQFYGQIVWVVNADSFRDNLSIKSIVRRKLKELEEERDAYSDRVIEDTEKLLKEIDGNIKKAKEKVDLLTRQIKYHEIDHQTVQRYLQEVETFCRQILNNWRGGWDNYNSLVPDVIGQLEQYKPTVLELTNKIHNLSSQQKATESNIKNLDNLTDCNLQDKGYKIVSYELLNKDNYSRVLVVQKSSMFDLFPVIEPIPDETSFYRFKFNQEQYCFLIDPAPIYEKYQAMSKEAAKQLIQTITERQNIEDTMIRQATELLRPKLDEIDQKISNLKHEMEAAEVTVADLEKCKQKTSEAKAIELTQAHALDEQNKNSEKYNVMRAFKGQYDLDWKHERKSWKSARCRVFFDLQDGFLYERTARWKVRKLAVLDFIAEMSAMSG